MLKKTQSGGGGAKVTFILPAQPGANHVHVVGDFNGWQASTPMKKQKDGTWKATLELEPGREYQFRYLVDGNAWVNDEAADAYVPNPFGADNCVLRLERGSSVASGRSRGGSAAGSAGARATKAATGKSAGAGKGAKAGSPQKKGGPAVGDGRSGRGSGSKTGGAGRSAGSKTGASGRARKGGSAGSSDGGRA